MAPNHSSAAMYPDHALPNLYNDNKIRQRAHPVSPLKLYYSRGVAKDLLKNEKSENKEYVSSAIAWKKDIKVTGEGAIHRPRRLPHLKRIQSENNLLNGMSTSRDYVTRVLLKRKSTGYPCRALPILNTPRPNPIDQSSGATHTPRHDKRQPKQQLYTKRKLIENRAAPFSEPPHVVTTNDPVIHSSLTAFKFGDQDDSYSRYKESDMVRDIKWYQQCFFSKDHGDTAEFRGILLCQYKLESRKAK